MGVARFLGGLGDSGQARGERAGALFQKQGQPYRAVHCYNIWNSSFRFIYHCVFQAYELSSRRFSSARCLSRGTAAGNGTASLEGGPNQGTTL